MTFPCLIQFQYFNMLQGTVGEKQWAEPTDKYETIHCGLVRNLSAQNKFNQEETTKSS